MNKFIASLTRFYLQPTGWLKSCETNSSVDAKGHPIPWWPYPAIEYLKTRIKPHHKVFEYGSGNSTLWLKKLSHHVISVEHDPKWHSISKAKLISHDDISNQQHFSKLQPFFDAKLDKILINDTARSWRAGLRTHEFKSYASELYNYPNGTFDIIIIDGMARVLCAWIAADVIKDDGLIIVDDAERDMYRLAYEYLSSNGFKRIDFSGIKPTVTSPTCTSVFLRKLTML